MTPPALPRRRFARRLFVSLLAVVSLPLAAADPARERREDFDAMWRAIDARYAYLGAHRTAWRRMRDLWRRHAVAAASAEEFIGVLEGALAALRDDHVSLSVRTPRSARRVPLDTDVWARWKDGVAWIESVRFAGDADVAGVHPGDIVTRIDGVPVQRAVDAWSRGAAASVADRDWALRHALAGPRDGPVALELGGREPRRVEIERSARASAPSPSLTARRMGEERDIGYLRLRHLDDGKLPEQVDSAMGYLKDARALIVDLREAQPGSRVNTLALLSRFARREGPWQLRIGRDGKRVADRVAPAAGGAFRAPLVVLVDRWTAGEGEALAAGLVAVASARLVGTPMAGLRGELHAARLPHSGIVVRFPGERTCLPDGTPREALRPATEIDPAAPNGGAGDPILYQALKLLDKRDPGTHPGDAPRQR